MQKEIAEETGMSRSQVSRYERGRDIPNLVTLVKFLNAVGASFCDLQDAMSEFDAEQEVSPSPPHMSLRDFVQSSIDADFLRPVVSSIVFECLDRSGSAVSHDEVLP
jgi:transcriptional regulator with XRE-family HTH domain